MRIPASRAPRALAFAFAALVFAPHAASGAVTIAEAAPKRSFLVAGADDCAALVAAFERSALSALWRDKEFTAWRERVSGDTPFDPLGRLKAAGVDIDALTPPTGAAGVALFLAPMDPAEEPPPEALGDDAVDVMHMLALADYVADEAGAKAALDALDRVAEQGVKDGVAKKDTLDYDDVEITRVKIDWEALDRKIDKDNGLEPALPAPAQDQEAENNADDFADFDEDYDLRSHLAEQGLPGVAMFARVGSIVLASSHLETMKAAIDRAEGRPGLKGESAGDLPEFTAALAQHEAGYQAYVVLPGGALGDYLGGEGAGTAPDLADRALPGAGFFADWGERMGAFLGLDAIRAVSLVARLDAPSGPVDGSIAVLTKEKRGLLALIDGPNTPIAPPPFVPADAASVFSHRFDVPALLPLLRTVAAGLPPEDRNEFEGMLELFGMQFGPALEAMGSQATILSRVEQPYSADSGRTVVALDAADPAKLSGALNTLGAMFGLTPREFQGNQVWDSPMGPGLGVGFGRLFLGAGPDIESAFREAGDPDRAKLASEPSFQRMLAAVGGQGIGFQYSRLKTGVEWSEWQARNIDRMLAEQFESSDWPPEDRAAFIEDMKASMSPWTLDPPPSGALLRHLGDAGGVMRSTPEGFVARWVVLKPGE